MSYPPKKSPFFQSCLGMAIVLMFVAAGLVWLNICLAEYLSSGWPQRMFSCIDREGHISFTRDDYGILATNIILCIGLLLAVATTCYTRVGQMDKDHALLILALGGLACLFWVVPESGAIYYPGLPLRAMTYLVCNILVILFVTRWCFHVLPVLYRERPRPFFRYSLLTAIVAMLTASVLLYANMRLRHVSEGGGASVVLRKL
jgi:hypothetical protein